MEDNPESVFDAISQQNQPNDNEIRQKDSFLTNVSERTYEESVMHQSPDASKSKIKKSDPSPEQNMTPEDPPKIRLQKMDSQPPQEEEK